MIDKSQRYFGILSLGFDFRDATLALGTDLVNHVLSNIIKLY